MVTVACVLRSGGIYTSEWVYALKRGVNRHLNLGEVFRFVCLTDMNPPVVDTVPLRHGWPGWWSKLELFRPGLFDGPVVYFDLDTLPVGDLSDIASYRGPLAVLSDFYQPKLAQSGVMAWTPGPHTEAIYNRFAADPARYRKVLRGDGEFLHAHAKPERLQALYPGQIVSFKVHARKGPPQGARLVAGHGNPRFNTTAAGWAHVEWKRILEHRLKEGGLV